MDLRITLLPDTEYLDLLRRDRERLTRRIKESREMIRESEDLIRQLDKLLASQRH